MEETMATLRSTWTATPITVEGNLGTAEWAGAGTMLIAGGGVNYGTVMMKNDANFLYIALDITRDQGNSTGDGDYFWLMVDVDRNRAITPHTDVNFGGYPGSPNSIGKQYFLGPATWTGLSASPGAQLHVGFGATPNAATAHRFWELRLSLTELGANLAEALPYIYFGLRLASSTPSFTFNSPDNAYTTGFGHLHQAFLARSADSVYAPGTAGAVIGGVGLIPASQISADGFATTAAPYMVQVKDAAFFGTLNLIGNHQTMQSLWQDGARKYRILHADPSAPTSFTPIRQAWANYHWNGTTYVLENFGPNASDMYPLTNPNQAYSIMDVLLQWQTTGAPVGAHKFQAVFFSAADVPVALPVSQTLTVAIDNNQPAVNIDSIKHGGVEVQACDIVTMANATDTLSVTYTAHDPEGHLAGYSVAGIYGTGVSAPIGSDVYAAHLSPPHTWAGVSAHASAFNPPTSCAYEFRVSASQNVTNGYSGPSVVSASRYVTIIKPGSPKFTVVAKPTLFGIPKPTP
jgi:hypothetical protein